MKEKPRGPRARAANEDACPSAGPIRSNLMDSAPTAFEEQGSSSISRFDPRVTVHPTGLYKEG